MDKLKPYMFWIICGVLLLIELVYFGFCSCSLRCRFRLTMCVPPKTPVEAHNRCRDQSQ